MDKKEFALFAMALKTYYPRENLLPNDRAMELWFKELQDIPYEVAEIGLQKWVSLNKWSPSIAEIREYSATIVNGEIAPWSEAWEEVRRALNNYGYYRADEALKSLSPIVLKAVKRIGFYELCTSENPEASRAKFRMIYEQIAEQEKRCAQMPANLKIMISQIQNVKMLEGT